MSIINENKTCPECGKKFHACQSCGLLHSYEFIYCSEECFKKSLTYDEKKRNFIKLLIELKNNLWTVEEFVDYVSIVLNDDLPIFLSDEEIIECWNNK